MTSKGTSEAAWKQQPVTQMRGMMWETVKN